MLIDLKHQGKVGVRETYIGYDTPDFFPRSEKDPRWLNYKGVFAPSLKR
jgi:hypothetical protein